MENKTISIDTFNQIVSGHKKIENGTYDVYYQSKKDATVQFKNNNKDGLWLFYGDTEDDIVERSKWNNGVLFEKIEYNYGKQVYKYSRKSKSVSTEEYFVNGRRRSLFNCDEQGLKHGNQIYFDENGKMVKVTTFNHGIEVYK